MITQH